MSYEFFHDPAYYDMWAVRKIGERDFNKTFHVATSAEAKELARTLSEKEVET